jgi:hypothetical protein
MLQTFFSRQQMRTRFAEAVKSVRAAPAAEKMEKCVEERGERGRGDCADLSLFRFSPFFFLG